MSEQIDKIFREKLGRHKAPVSSAPDIWAAIASDQARKRKRARLMTATKYAGALLLLLAIVWPSYNYFNSSIDAAAEQEIKSGLPAATFQLKDEAQAVSTPLVTEQPPNSLADNGDISAQVEVDQLADRRLTNHATTATDKKILNQSASSTVMTSGSAASEKLTEQVVLGDQPIQMIEESRTTLAAVDQRADQLPTLPLPILSPRAASVPAPVANVLDQEQESFERSKKNRLEIDLLAGPAYANQLFTLDDEADRELLNAREISEFPTVSLLAGVRVSYRLGPRWSIRTGLLYTQVRNQFEFEQRSPAPSEATILIKSSNQIKMLEVPLLASFTLPGRRFRLALNAGPVINLSTTANGRYLLPDLMEPVSLEDENIYRNNIGLSYQFSFTAAYDLGMGNSLLVEPTFKNYRSSFTHADYALNERYWLAGLQIGLRHRIR
ncbi:hypothetical protein CEQ90_15880 [Lewinellaceae bacterium SD302]|nr:hypothetical protein CEQ90_15880 [Lewinellaceae bacterium SD302]